MYEDRHLDSLYEDRIPDVDPIDYDTYLAFADYDDEDYEEDDPYGWGDDYFPEFDG